MFRQVNNPLSASHKSITRGFAKCALLAMFIAAVCCSVPAGISSSLAQEPPVVDPTTGAPVPPQGMSNYDAFIDYLANVDPSLIPSFYPVPPKIDEFEVMHPNSDEWVIYGHVMDLDGPNEGLIVNLHGALEGASTLTMVDGYFLVVVHSLPFSEGWIGATAIDVTGLVSTEEGTFYTP